MAYDPKADLMGFLKQGQGTLNPMKGFDSFRMGMADKAAGASSDPIVKALQDQYQAAIDPTRRATLGGFASRGFGLSGMADQGIAGALANLKTDFDKKKSDARQAAIDREREQANQELTLRAQQQAAKPDKFLGII